MHKAIGNSIIMTHNLVKEYNPDVYEKIKDKFDMKYDDLKPTEYYDAEYLNAILKELSPSAQEVLGKRIFPATEEITGAFKGITDPAQIFKGWPTHYLENNIDDEGGDLGKIESIEVEDGKAVITENTHWPGDFTRGVAMGIIYIAGIKTAIRGKTEIIKEGEFPTYKHTIVWK